MVSAVRMPAKRTPSSHSPAEVPDRIAITTSRTKSGRRTPARTSPDRCSALIPSTHRHSTSEREILRSQRDPTNHQRTDIGKDLDSACNARLKT